MPDAHLYLKATKEVEDNSQDPALWAKAMALGEGDADKAKYTYINLRVETLSVSDDQYQNAPSNTNDVNYNKPTPSLTTEEPKQALEFAPKKEPDNQPPTPKKSPHRSIPDGYITLEAYTKNTGTKPAEIIALVNDGYHSGKLIGEQWYISTVDDTALIKNKNTPPVPALPMKWFMFWTYLLLPIHSLGAVAFIAILSGSKTDNGGILFLLWILFFFLITLILGLHNKKLWAWKNNWIYIFIMWGVLIDNNASQALSSFSTAETIIYFIFFVIYAAIWFWPNEVYWSKRKHFFTP